MDPTSVPTILAPMTDERRPKGKPTEDRKLLRSAPYADPSFLDSDAWRALRIQGEVIEGFDSLARLGPAVSIFGSARTHSEDPMYVHARDLAARLTRKGITIVTGGGPGIMEAANRGAADVGGVSVGLGIELPHEQRINEYANIAINFRYFFARKLMFVKYAQAFVIFPGGYGTLDELFEALVLVQTGKIDHFPIVLWGRAFWQPLVDWLSSDVLDQRMIAPEDLKLFRITEDVDDAVAWIEKAFVKADQAARKAEKSPVGKEPAEAAQERRHQVTARPE
jgi:uncharacterized protein (TIGR00730 family)